MKQRNLFDDRTALARDMISRLHLCIPALYPEAKYLRWMIEDNRGKKIKIRCAEIRRKEIPENMVRNNDVVGILHVIAGIQRIQARKKMEW